MLLNAMGWNTAVVFVVVDSGSHDNSCTPSSAGIEKQLETNTEERASADLRIRKSQVIPAVDNNRPGNSFAVKWIALTGPKSVDKRVM